LLAELDFRTRLGGAARNYCKERGGQAKWCSRAPSRRPSRIYAVAERARGDSLSSLSFLSLSLSLSFCRLSLVILNCLVEFRRGCEILSDLSEYRSRARYKSNFRPFFSSRSLQIIQSHNFRSFFFNFFIFIVIFAGQSIWRRSTKSGYI